MKKLVNIKFVEGEDEPLLHKYEKALDTNDIEYVVFRDGTFSSGEIYINMYIAPGHYKYVDIYKMINGIKSQKYTLIPNHYIENGYLHEYVGIVYI